MSFSSCSRMWQCQTYCGLATPGGSTIVPSSGSSNRARMRVTSPGMGLHGVLAAVLVGRRAHGRPGIGDRLRRRVVGGDVERPAIDDLEGHEVQVDRVRVGGRVDQQPVLDGVGPRSRRDDGESRGLVEVGRVLDVERDRRPGERVERLRQVLHASDGRLGQPRERRQLQLRRGCRGRRSPWSRQVDADLQELVQPRAPAHRVRRPGVARDDERGAAPPAEVDDQVGALAGAISSAVIGTGARNRPPSVPICANGSALPLFSSANWRL